MKKLSFNELANFSDKFPKQIEASETADTHKFTLYGGAMGGGKSKWLRWYPIAFLMKQAAKGHPNLRGALFCEDYPSLQDRHLSKIKFEYPSWLGSYNDKTHEFTLHRDYGGGVLAFRNLDDPSKYQSAEFAIIAVDELTRNSIDVFHFLRTRLRWPGVIDVRFIAGANPGGIGHAWVRKIFMQKEFEPGEREADEFVFVSSSAKDNPYLDQSYYDSLSGLPEDMRRAYLEGNWDVFQGQYFSEWNREIHVCEPFTIPKDWKRYRGLDHGSFAPTACGWYAISPDGTIYCYRDYEENDRLASIHAARIRGLSKGEEITATFADPSMWIKGSTDGKSAAELYERAGVPLMKANNDRINGWRVVREYLKGSVDARPQLQIFSTCTKLIKAIPEMIHDERHPEDLLSDGTNDHHPDQLRYFLISRSRPRGPKKAEAPPGSFQAIMKANARKKEFQERYGHD